MKRCAVLVACLLLLFASSCAVLWVDPEQPHREPCPVNVGPETRERLLDGMSRSEVEAILGGPEGDYRRNKNHCGFPGFSVNGPTLSLPAGWYTDEYAILVYFDSEGKAKSIDCLRATPPPPVPNQSLRKIREILGL